MIVREKNRKIFVLSSLVLALVGCSGGKDDTPNNTANTVQPNHNANAIGGAEENAEYATDRYVALGKLLLRDNYTKSDNIVPNVGVNVRYGLDPAYHPNQYITNSNGKYVYYHTGIDYRANKKPVYSISHGKVVAINKKYGAITVETNGKYVSYLHMSLDKNDKHVAINTTVCPGLRIGTSGDTGTPGQPHLHIELNNKKHYLGFLTSKNEIVEQGGLSPLTLLGELNLDIGEIAKGIGLPPIVETCPIQPTTPIYPNNPPPIHPTTPVTPPTPTVQRPYLEGGVNIVPLNDRSFQLNSRTATGDVSYYELWRSNSSGQRGSKLGTSSNNYFTDTPPMGQTVYYTIGACNSAGCSYSSQDYHRIEKPRPQFYNGTSGVNIERTSYGFRLNSRQVTHAEYYKLYRSRYAGSKGEYITSSGSNYFTDNNVQRGITYYYQIEACNSSGCTLSTQDYHTF